MKLEGKYSVTKDNNGGFILEPFREATGDSCGGCLVCALVIGFIGGSMLINRVKEKWPDTWVWFSEDGWVIIAVYSVTIVLVFLAKEMGTAVMYFGAGFFVLFSLLLTFLILNS